MFIFLCLKPFCHAGLMEHMPTSNKLDFASFFFETNAAALCLVGLLKEVRERSKESIKTERIFFFSIWTKKTKCLSIDVYVESVNSIKKGRIFTFMIVI